MAEEPTNNPAQEQEPPEIPASDATPADSAETEGDANVPGEVEAVMDSAGEPVLEPTAEPVASEPDRETDGPGPGEPQSAATPEADAADESGGSAEQPPGGDVEADMAALLEQVEQEATGGPVAEQPPLPTEAPAASPPAEDVAAAAMPFEAPDLTEAQSGDELGRIDLLDDVELDVRIELGRTEMYIEDVVRLEVGSVIELDKLAGDPVDIYVNGRLVARGEVIVLNDNFCVRVNDILSPIPELETAQ
jgi:flagellar motor switch protein FliN/FliY